MNSATRHLFFDLDHTLWDFDANSASTFADLLVEFAPVMRKELSLDQFYDVYHKHNEKLWHRYRNNEIDSLELRESRFRLTFEELEIESDHWRDEFGDLYLNRCPQKTGLMPNAIPTLEYLASKYSLHLITNGFRTTQQTKLKHSGLEKYFDVVVTSDDSNSKKPHPDIFHEALKRTGASAENAIHVGDDLVADVQGGLNAGFQVIWYNPNGQAGSENFQGLPFQQIMDLSELQHLL